MLLDLFDAGLVGFIKQYLIVSPYHLLGLFVALRHHVHLGVESGERRYHLPVQVLEVVVQRVLLHLFPLPLSLYLVSLARQIRPILHLELLELRDLGRDTVVQLVELLR